MAPVGGTMWAASPARNRRPWRIGSATNERSGATLFSIDGPVCRAAAASAGMRRFSSPRTARPASPRRPRRAAPAGSSGCASASASCRARSRARVGVDQLVVDGRRIGEDAEPAEGIDALVDADRLLRDRLAADAVEAVAAGDEVAVDLVALAAGLCSAGAACRSVRPCRLTSSAS